MFRLQRTKKVNQSINHSASIFSREAIKESVPPKQESKPRTRKTWDMGNRRPNVGCKGKESPQEDRAMIPG